MKFQLSIMPEEKIAGSHDKWIDKEVLEADSRRIAVTDIVRSKKNEQYNGKYPQGAWRLKPIKE